MSTAPSPDSLPGTSLLALARHWFPPTIVAGVFEPLVADWQREEAGARSRSARLRFRAQWTAAFLSALMLSGLRQLAVLPPAQVAVDAGARGLMLATFGFVLQRSLQRPHGEPGLNIILIDSLPFAMIAIVDTIRAAESVPLYRRRLLAMQAVAAAALVLAVFGAVSPAQRLALACIPVVLGVFGWTVRDWHLRTTNWFSRWVVSIAITASALSLSIYPFKWTLGMNLFDRWWGGEVMYAVAILTVLRWLRNTKGGSEDPPFRSISS